MKTSPVTIVCVLLTRNFRSLYRVLYIHRNPILPVDDALILPIKLCRRQIHSIPHTECQAWYKEQESSMKVAVGVGGWVKQTQDFALRDSCPI